MTLQELNTLPSSEIKQQLFQCCGSSLWVEEMMKGIPYTSLTSLQENADSAWSLTKEEDWKEAFLDHPMIGDINSLREKFASTKQWASGEQSSVTVADDEVLSELKKLNNEYHQRFGYIFIICATGKSVAEMMASLIKRMENSPFDEIRIASEEQRKIMQLRILKLLS